MYRSAKIGGYGGGIVSLHVKVWKRRWQKGLCRISDGKFFSKIPVDELSIKSVRRMDSGKHRFCVCGHKAQAGMTCARYCPVYVSLR